MKTKIALVSLLLAITLFSCKKDDAVMTSTVDFESLTTGTQGYWNGSDQSGHFTNGGVTFPNAFSAQYGSWEGFAYSNLCNTTNGLYANQFSVFDATNGTNHFGLYYPPFGGPVFATFVDGKSHEVNEIYLCNSTYTALTIKNGDPAFAKKFGGTSGNDQDWFKVTIKGLDAAGQTTGSVDFYLADYRFTDNTKDYIVNKWTRVDLSALGKVAKLTFEFNSTDVGQWGMNTPAYVCFDRLKYVSE